MAFGDARTGGTTPQLATVSIRRMPFDVYIQSARARPCRSLVVLAAGHAEDINQLGEPDALHDVHSSTHATTIPARFPGPNENACKACASCQHTVRSNPARALRSKATSLMALQRQVD